MTEPINLPELWTPLYDTLVSELGLYTAVVYGVIWRYCQMQQHVCRASLDTLAARTGLCKRSIIRHIKILVENGYLADLTPDLKHAPHIYTDAHTEGIPPAGATAGDDPTSPAPVVEDSAGSDRQARRKGHKVIPGVTGGHPGSDWESPREGLRVTPGVTGGHPRSVKKSPGE